LNKISGRGLINQNQSQEQIKYARRFDALTTHANTKANAQDDRRGGFAQAANAPATFEMKICWTANETYAYTRAYGYDVAPVQELEEDEDQPHALNELKYTSRFDIC
jgi:hypothetical protein